MRTTPAEQAWKLCTWRVPSTGHFSAQGAQFLFGRCVQAHLHTWLHPLNEKEHLQLHLWSQPVYSKNPAIPCSLHTWESQVQGAPYPRTEWQSLQQTCASASSVEGHSCTSPAPAPNGSLLAPSQKWQSSEYQTLQTQPLLLVSLTLLLPQPRAHNMSWTGMHREIRADARPDQWIQK